VAEQEYTRLTRGHIRTGFAVAVTSRCSLWLGHDHVLFIDSNGYTETYKRFYFGDIQAFNLALTKRKLLWNCIWGALGGLCLLVWSALFLANPPMRAIGLIAGAGMALLFAVLLLVNNLLGPTCICQIRTAVQVEDLPPLNRLRRARRVLDRLRPLITAAQSQLTQQKPSDELQAAEATAPPAISPEEVSGAPSPPPPLISDGHP